jgi:hypothetical protein
MIDFINSVSRYKMQAGSTWTAFPEKVAVKIASAYNLGQF